MNATAMRGGKLPAIVARFVVVASALVAGEAWAEGSRSLYPATYNSAGARANADVSGSGSKYVGQVARRTFLYVYAETGEYILTGSRNRSNGGDIRIFNPRSFGQPGDETIPSSEDFSCDEGTSQPGTHFAGSGRGTIASRTEELAGPDSADGTVTVPSGFRPCAYQAPTSGIFGVLFTRASSGSGANGSVSNPAVSDDSVAAWDVTVRATATSTTDLNGRLFTYAFVGITNSSGRRLFSDLYYVTLDGYRYRQTMRGVDPQSFAFFANSSGFLDSGNPLYRDIRGEDQAVSELPPGIASQPAQLPIFFSDISPGAPADTEASKVLGALGVPSSPPPPQVQAVRFRGSLGVGATTVGAGGNFDFFTTNTFTFQIVISRDGVDFSPTNPLNRVLRGIAGTGPHTILWDGRDNINGLFPVGVDYPFILTGRNGEAHFPFVDVEGNASGGPTIRKLTPPQSTTVFYDDRGYVTSLGQSIGTPNGLLCGDTPPTPPTPNEGLAGVDSNAVDGSGRYYRFWPGNRSTNDDCNHDSAFGDTKGLDLWVFQGTTALRGTLSIFDAPDFVDVGTSVAVPLVIFPGQTVFGNAAFRNDGLVRATGVSYSLTLGTAGNRPASVNFPTLSGSAFSYNPSTGVVTFSGLPVLPRPGRAGRPPVQLCGAGIRVHPGRGDHLGGQREPGADVAKYVDRTDRCHRVRRPDDRHCAADGCGRQCRDRRGDLPEQRHGNGAREERHVRAHHRERHAPAGGGHVSEPASQHHGELLAGLRRRDVHRASDDPRPWGSPPRGVRIHRPGVGDDSRELVDHDKHSRDHGGQQQRVGIDVVRGHSRPDHHEDSFGRFHARTDGRHVHDHRDQPGPRRNIEAGGGR